MQNAEIDLKSYQNNMDKKNIQIYTDGACSGNPGIGGWACVLIYKTKVKEMSGGEKETTNNRMEMMAIVKGLSALTEPCNVEVFSDSAYCVNAFNQNWIGNWQKNGWKNSKKEEVKNIDLWRKLLELTKFHNVKFVKVKGHSTNVLNNRCDELAVAEVKRFQCYKMD